MWLDDWDGKVPIPVILKPRPLWSGKQIINMFLPRVNLVRKASWYNDKEVADLSPTDSQVRVHLCHLPSSSICDSMHCGLDHVTLFCQVLIQSGYLLQGTLCKKTLGAAGGGLIHIIFMEHGSDAANAFLSQCQYTVNYWLLQHGFSIGIGDTVADEATMATINTTINQVRWLGPQSICETPGWGSSTGRVSSHVTDPSAGQG